MRGSSLLFMSFAWITVCSFVVFCFTVILREGEKRKAREEREEFEFEEEIT
jgi:hypothetical protein